MRSTPHLWIIIYKIIRKLQFSHYSKLWDRVQLYMSFLRILIRFFGYGSSKAYIIRRNTNKNVGQETPPQVPQVLVNPLDKHKKIPFYKTFFFISRPTFLTFLPPSYSSTFPNPLFAFPHPVDDSFPIVYSLSLPTTSDPTSLPSPTD